MTESDTACNDVSALTQLMARLCRAMDRRDRDGLVACYTPDAYDDHGAFKGSGPEFSDYLCRATPELRTHHQLGQSLFDVDGDEAWGETYFTMFGLGAPLYGRYVDYCRRHGTQWLLAYRRVVPEVTARGDDIDNYWRSRPDHDDPVYDRLRRPPQVSARGSRVDPSQPHSSTSPEGDL